MPQLLSFLIASLRTRNEAGLDAVEWSTILIVLILFLGTIGTGGLLSTEKSLPLIVSRINHIIPYFTLANDHQYILFFIELVKESPVNMILVNREVPGKIE
ncbi:MAG: hypothetical protein EH225_04300 [Calditrichaeota bacterium]|nr:hypothetical protein [Calditrichota bacterium]RQW05806.1 MAG: hypothetical protein EH225_04300 [Calditrichota bacterium]